MIFSNLFCIPFLRIFLGLFIDVSAKFRSGSDVLNSLFIAIVNWLICFFKSCSFLFGIVIVAYASLGKAKCAAEIEGFLLILADKKSNKIIGASCIGAEAPELIAEIALAMQHGLTAHELGETIHSHPTISEMVLEAAEDVFGMAIHKKGRPIHH